MSPLEFLLQRHSCAQLTAPAPTDEQLNTMFQCAMRAPDHGNLQPYRFVVISGERLQQLGRVYRHALEQKGERDNAKLDRAESLPLRAPMIIVAVAHYVVSEKTPPQEQLITAGIAAAQLINGAQLLGLGAYWRTGELAYNDNVKTLLGCAENEAIIGFIYTGTPKQSAHAPTIGDPVAIVRRW